MTNNVYWLGELEVAPENLDAFKALGSEMMESTRQETGCLNYEFSMSADGRSCHAYERYADSDAVMAHLAVFGSKFAERLMKLATFKRIDVYGAPNATVRQALADFQPSYHEPLAGFSR